MKIHLKIFVLTIGLIGICFALQAQSIIFTFSGVGSGSLGGTDFNDAIFNFQFEANTNNLSHIGPNIPSYSQLSGTVTVGGFVASLESLPEFSSPYYVFNNQNSPQGIPVVGFGGQYDDFLGITASDVGLETYGLTTSFGPISGSITLSNFYALPTSSGEFDLAEANDLTFQAVTSAPEPSSFGLLLVGAVVLSAYFWRKHQGMRN